MSHSIARSSLPSTSAQSLTPSPSPTKQPQRRGTGTNTVDLTSPKLVDQNQPLPLPHPEGALLIPTDRTRGQLEDRWLKRLGRFSVLREQVLSGYSLYIHREWYLSRTRFSQSIITSTGKPTDHVTTYVLVPDGRYPEKEAKLEVDMAVQYLINETGGFQRKTDFGVLLLHTAASFTKEVSSIPSGDMREAESYNIVNTGLRRLGCGGRAILGMDYPTPALRRKFLELYRLPTPPNTTAPLSRTSSPIIPSSSSPKSPSSPPTPAPALRQDHFFIMVVETIKLVQTALAIWGLFGLDRDIDGLFCDETKVGVAKWRELMGMDKGEAYKLEVETSGGCIEPKTLAGLLSSITTVTYELNALGIDPPKDPFRRVKRFLSRWADFGEMADNTPDCRGQVSQYLDVNGIRTLNKVYRSRRVRLPSDWTNVPHTLVSGVAHATSSLSANLKGGAAEDGPLRRRELRPDLSSSSSSSSPSGMSLITPDHELLSSGNGLAPPDAILTNLEIYTKGIMRTKDKDWALIGARRIGELWKGSLFEQESKRGLGGLLGRKPTVREASSEDESDEGGRTKGALARTGQAFKDLVGRKGSVAETSDSDTGGVMHHLIRRKPNAVPTLIEPNLEEVDEQPDLHDLPHSPSRRQFGIAGLVPPGASASTYRSSRSRPSINTNLSHEDYAYPQTANGDRNDPATRALAWRARGRATTMLRTSSDGADVAIEENGLEWEVINPHGTGKGQHERPKPEIQRRHSLEPPEKYSGVRPVPAEHLATDVAMCALVLELRARERRLAQKAFDMKTLAASITSASQTLGRATDDRQAYLAEELQPAFADLQQRLRQAMSELEPQDHNNDESLDHASRNLSNSRYRLDPDTQRMRELLGSVKDYIRYGLGAGASA